MVCDVAPWGLAAQLSAEDYMNKVPAARRPMVVCQGKVEGPCIEGVFQMVGTVYGVSVSLSIGLS